MMPSGIFHSTHKCRGYFVISKHFLKVVLFLEEKARIYFLGRLTQEGTNFRVFCTMIRCFSGYMTRQLVV